jgi:hypothetical protein
VIDLLVNGQEAGAVNRFHQGLHLFSVPWCDPNGGTSTRRRQEVSMTACLENRHPKPSRGSLQCGCLLPSEAFNR